jgi:hypothetical protein
MQEIDKRSQNNDPLVAPGFSERQAESPARKRFRAIALGTGALTI